MTASTLNESIRRFRRTIALPDEFNLSDSELLARFEESQEEAAFAALVRRHGPQVLEVCRRVLGNEHDAADAFQATFLVLVRKASGLKDRAKLGNWLHGVAQRCALRARAIARRRQTHECQGIDYPEPATPRARPWEDCVPDLQRELSRLPPKYRLAVEMCELRGLSRKTAAAELALAEGTLSSRLATARRMLAQRLAPSVVPVGCSTVHVPAVLRDATIQAAVRLASDGFRPSLGAAIIMQGVLKAMFLNKMGMIAAGVIFAGVAGIGMQAACQQASGGMGSVQNPEVKLSIAAFNSKGFYIVAKGKEGEEFSRLAWSGRETVRSAFERIGRLPALAANTRIWLARPGIGVMTIDWKAINERNDLSTNHVILPHDRIYIDAFVSLPSPQPKSA